MLLSTSLLVLRTFLHFACECVQRDCDASIGLEPLISLAGQSKFKLAAVFVVAVFSPYFFL